MNTAQIDAMVRAAVARAGYSADLVPSLRDLVCFHVLMMRNLSPEGIGIMIEELMPGMAEAWAEEAKAAQLSITLSDTVH